MVGVAVSDLRNLEAEMAVLGAALLDARMLERVSIHADHFSEAIHRDIWNEMKMRHRDGRVADMVSMKEWAKAHVTQELGGFAYLMKLVNAATSRTDAQVIGYGPLLRDLTRRRALTQAAKDAANECATGLVDGEAIQAALEQRLQEIAASENDADAWESLGALACEAVERAQLGEAKGIGTGFNALDRVVGGLQAGTLVVVGGATSMGKSVFGDALARNIAAQGFGVGCVHLEMDRTQIGLRTAAALAFRNDHRVSSPSYLQAIRNDLPREAWDALNGSAKAVASMPIYTDARPGRTLSQIEAAARRLFQKMRREGVAPGALVIDHEGLIASEGRYPSQLEAANARANGLLAMAKRLGVVVIALSQITKEGSRADGEDRLPTAQDLNYGSALSQAASVVMLIHRKAYYAERKPEKLRTPDEWDSLNSRETTVVVDKARGGQRGQIKILMDMASSAVWEAA